MENKITEVAKFDVNINTVPGTFTMNFEEAKKQIKQIADSFRIIVYDEDQEKQQKLLNEDISTIKAHINRLEEYKKKEKEAYSEPLNLFTKQMNELIALFNEPYETLRSKKVEFQKEAKRKKSAKIREYFDVLCVDFPIVGNYKESLYASVYDSKWENTNSSVTTYKTAIKDALVNYKNGIESINAVGGKYVEQGIKEFQNTLSLISALDVMTKLKKRDDEIAEKNRIFLEQEKIRIQEEAMAKARKEVEKEMQLNNQPVNKPVTEVANTQNAGSESKSPNTNSVIEEIEMDFSGFVSNPTVAKEVDFVSVKFSSKDFEQIKAFCTVAKIQYDLL